MVHDAPSQAMFNHVPVPLRKFPKLAELKGALWLELLALPALLCWVRLAQRHGARDAACLQYSGWFLLCLRCCMPVLLCRVCPARTQCACNTVPVCSVPAMLRPSMPAVLCACDYLCLHKFKCKQGHRCGPSLEKPLIFKTILLFRYRCSRLSL